MMSDLSQWTACARPERKVMEGRYVRLEPLSAARHGDGLYAASSVPDVAERFRWLYEFEPESREAFQAWMERNEASDDPIFFAVIDKASGRVAGRQTFMRIDEKNGVGEIGNIYWGPLISRKPAATEALYLFARHIFDDLGYRRFEWKTNNNNEASKRAAVRFGFQPEGVFRQHLVVKGENRDTAWFSMIDSEWPLVRKALESWLDPANFDAGGKQVRRLEDIRESLRG
jgi:RimJ/RimL family protein N-acetyltransferase